MAVRKKINSNIEPESFEAKIGSKQSVQTPVRGTELPISFLGVLSKTKISQKREKMFARQREILARYAMEAML